MPTVADIRAEGVRLTICCPNCARLRYLNIDRLDQSATLEEVAAGLKCTRCLEPDIEVRIMRCDPETGFWPAESAR
ncbi:hypothetical protein [Breoghania sp.]|uniref:hypothetical protein n=1 Tax=Breoghania sp. TaxID=2065378 RepID=UPI002605EB6D|nr:hypothetical protein [Breoghania sp.]MDJ0932258.1 hypothetical protein [Breoghania sp.]